MSDRNVLHFSCAPAGLALTQMRMLTLPCSLVRKTMRMSLMKMQAEEAAGSAGRAGVVRRWRLRGTAAGWRGGRQQGAVAGQQGPAPGRPPRGPALDAPGQRLLLRLAEPARRITSSGRSSRGQTGRRVQRAGGQRSRSSWLRSGTGGSARQLLAAGAPQRQTVPRRRKRRSARCVGLGWVT